MKHPKRKSALAVPNDSDEFSIDFPIKCANLGLSLECDFLKTNVVVKTIHPGSLASSHDQLKFGVVLIRVNGTNVEGQGYRETMRHLREAHQGPTTTTPRLEEEGSSFFSLSFRKASVHYRRLSRDQVSSVHYSRIRSVSNPSVQMSSRTSTMDDPDAPPNANNCLTPPPADDPMTEHDHDLDNYVQTITILQNQLKIAQAQNIRHVEKIQILLCNQKLRTSSSAHGSSVDRDARRQVILGCRLLAWASIAGSVSNFVLPHFQPEDEQREERSWHNHVFPKGLTFSLVMGLLSSGVAMLGYVLLGSLHFNPTSKDHHPGMKHRHHHSTSPRWFFFLLLGFVLLEGHGMYLTAASLSESKSRLVSGLVGPVQVVLCATEQEDHRVTSCRPDTTTWDFVEFVQLRWANVWFTLANLGLSYVLMKTEKQALVTLPATKTPEVLPQDLQHALAWVHGLSLATRGICDQVLPLTSVFCLACLHAYYQNVSHSRHQVIHSYFYRVAWTALVVILSWIFTR